MPPTRNTSVYRFPRFRTDKQLRIAMLGSGPDVVYTAGPATSPAWPRPDSCARRLCPETRLDDRILPVFIELGKYNGKLYALPKTYETLGLFYNKTLFDANGWTPPKTIAELETLADAMKAKNIVPFGAGNADWRPTNEHHVSIILNSVAGPDNVYKALTGEIPWTAEPFVKAIDTLNKWWQAGYFGPNYFSLTGERAFAQVATGQAGCRRPAPKSPTFPLFPQNNAEPASWVPSAEGIGPVYAWASARRSRSLRHRKIRTARQRSSTTSSATNSMAR